jgi:hypothetical protein
MERLPLLPAALLYATHAALGCDREPRPQPALEPTGPCAPYGDVESLWEYCGLRELEALDSATEADAYCGGLGSWEGLCRTTWISSRLQPDSGVSREELLRVCAGAPDCAFEVLDWRPADDVLDQLEFCREHSAGQREDCAVHALERWAAGRPDAAERARIVAASTSYPKWVGEYLGVAIGCGGEGSCAGSPEVVRWCEFRLQRLEPVHCEHKRDDGTRRAGGRGRQALTPP